MNKKLYIINDMKLCRKNLKVLKFLMLLFHFCILSYMEQMLYAQIYVHFSIIEIEKK